jgi:dihydroorotase
VICAPSSRTALAFDDRGTLNIGAPPEVATMEQAEGPLEFLDNYEGTRTGHQAG